MSAINHGRWFSVLVKILSSLDHRVQDPCIDIEILLTVIASHHDQGLTVCLLANNCGIVVHKLSHNWVQFEGHDLLSVELPVLTC